MDEQLIRFVEHAQLKGLDHATTRQLLLSAGWRDKEIAEVICARQLDLPIPVPERATAARLRSTGRSGVPRKADAFLHLLAFGSLYAWSTTVVLLLFTYLDFAFPDPAWRTSYNQVQALMSIMRFQLAVVLVSFPVFLVAWDYLLAEVRRRPETGGGVLRRWLGNLSLFVGSITLAANTMTLIYFLLEGQLTARLVLKAAVLFLIAGGLVGYLASTLRNEAKKRTEIEP